MPEHKLPSTAPNPNNYAGFLVWQIANKWEKYVNSTLKKHGTTQGEYFHLISILILSGQIPEVTQVEIAKSAGGSIMNTSKTLKNLEEKGWIERRAASDPRAKQVSVSKTGMQKAIELAAVLEQANSTFYGEHHTSKLIQLLAAINTRYS
ncbi:MAG: MarR family transcriptional regulator [Patescibacteria group bacterium]